MFAGNQNLKSALGPALQAAEKLLVSGLRVVLVFRQLATCTHVFTEHARGLDGMCPVLMLPDQKFICFKALRLLVYMRYAVIFRAYHVSVASCITEKKILVNKVLILTWSTND